MRIIISGIGETGYYLAQILLKEGHDLVLVEQDEKRFMFAKEHLDAQIIHGNGADALVLEPLIDESTDLFISMTNNDAANILAVMIARRFGIQRCITRVIKSSNLIHPLLTEDPNVCVLNSEMAVAKDLIRLVGNPTADEIEFFANGKAEMMKLHVGDQSKVLQQKLKDIKIPKSWIFIAMIRRGQFSVLNGESALEYGDQVLMMGDPEKTNEVEELLGLHQVEVKRVIIVGYNDISETLVKSLYNKDIEVRLIEEESGVAEQAAAELDRILVLQGDGTSDEILEQAGIEQTDVLLALTDDDETNVLISLLAKEKKVNRVIALGHKPQYKPIIEKIGIDSIINPRSVMVDEIIRSIHHEDLAGVNILEGGQGQMLEFVVKNKTKFVDVSLEKLKLPKQTLIGAIVRNDDLIIPRGGDRIKIGDRIVVFTMRSSLFEVKKLFAK